MTRKLAVLRIARGRIQQNTMDSLRMIMSLQKELDEVKNAMKGKTAMNLDGMLKRMDSPFITSVLECPLPPKFHLP